MNEIRRYAVGMSLEALAGAWARTEEAPAGSCVVLDQEISGRLRGGVPWKRPAGLMMAVVQRPQISPLQEPMLWLAATLGAARAIASVTGVPAAVTWPDTVLLPHTDSDADLVVCSTNIAVQLGPGRVEHAVFAVRVSLDGPDLDDERLLAELHRELGATTKVLDTDPTALIDEFAGLNPMMDQLVKASLMPRGEARGKMVAIDQEGMLVLESATGMLERVAPASLRKIELA